MDKREQVVDLITRTIENDSLIHKQKVKMTISNIFWNKLKEERQYDKLIEMMIKGCGLGFALNIMDLEDWNSPMNESLGSPVPVELWERTIRKQSKLAQKLQEERDQRQADLERIVKAVQTGTTKEALNRAIELAAPLYKLYGEIWLKELKDALDVNVKPQVVKQFLEYVKRQSDSIIHLKEKKDAKKKTTAKEYSKELSAKEARKK